VSPLATDTSMSLIHYVGGSRILQRLARVFAVLLAALIAGCQATSSPPIDGTE
jgi:hypothetical protein